jgi:peptidoglycan/xylan/chitin deacetylase (PgdA/CDA1 family)
MKQRFLIFAYLLLGLMLDLTNTHCYAAENSVLEHSAVVLMYHHVSSSTPPSTSISPEDFAKHMEYVNTHFNVISLKTAIDKLKSGKKLNPNSLVITFDDGYRNILENGHPILSSLNFPYTIFINPGRIGIEKGQLSWDEVIDMQKQGVTFANHTMDHLHLLDKLPEETENQWIIRVWQNISEAQQHIEEKLGKAPKWLAYPFGEYNETLANKMAAEGYIGLGQHSGAISAQSDFTALPRFPAAGIYANLRTLKTKMHSLAMPIVESFPRNPERPLGATLELSFTFASDDVRASQLQCFFAGDVIPHNQQNNAVTITSDIELPIGRSRVNCTAPSQSQSGRYYWYSQPFFVPNKDGLFPN